MAACNTTKDQQNQLAAAAATQVEEEASITATKMMEPQRFTASAAPFSSPKMTPALVTPEWKPKFKNPPLTLEHVLIQNNVALARKQQEDNAPTPSIPSYEELYGEEEPRPQDSRQQLKTLADSLIQRKQYRIPASHSLANTAGYNPTKGCYRRRCSITKFSLQVSAKKRQSVYEAAREVIKMAQNEHF